MTLHTLILIGLFRMNHRKNKSFLKWTSSFIVRKLRFGISTLKRLIRGLENNFLIHEGGENNLVQSCQTIQSQRYDLSGEEKYPQGKVFIFD